VACCADFGLVTTTGGGAGNAEWLPDPSGSGAFDQPPPHRGWWAMLMLKDTNAAVYDQPLLRWNIDAIQAIHLDSPADETIRSLICKFPGWVQHTEISPQRLNNADSYLSVSGHVAPLRRTLYPRSDLDSRYGMAFALYVDLQLIASAARTA